MDIKQIIESSYKEIEKSSEDQKSNLLFNIIQIKSENRQFEKINNSLYIDIKCFIECYINSLNNEDYGYDVVDLKKIEIAIKSEKSKSAKYELSEFCIRCLKSNNHESLVDKFKIKNLKFKFFSTLEKPGIINFFKSILILTSFNLLSLFITVSFLVSLTILLLHEAYIPCFELYQIKYDAFSTNLMINKLLNVIAKPFGIAENFKLIPQNEYAVLLLIFLKSLYLIFIGNFIIERFKEYLFKN